MTRHARPARLAADRSPRAPAAEPAAAQAWALGATPWLDDGPQSLAQRKLISGLFGRAGALPPPRGAAGAVAQREDGEGEGVNRADHEPALDEMAAAALAAELAPARERVAAYLRKGLGVGGAGFTRSSQVRAFRARMKTAAREQAARDIDQALPPATGQRTATQDYMAVAAREKAYAPAKESVDHALADKAEQWLAANWDAAAMADDARAAVKDAAWPTLAEGPGSAKRQAAAAKAARGAAKTALAPVAEAKLQAAQDWKNRIVKPEDSGAAEVEAERKQYWLSRTVADRASSEHVGQRALQTAIEANTTDAALGKVGQFLDQMLPQPGDSASLSIELKIPIPDSPAYVTLKLEGKAGRGTTGFSTSGVTTLGDPKRLEVMARFSVGVGAETFGLKGDLSVGFFVRAGANAGTAATMKSLSYGAYRSAAALNDAFGNWWAGSGKGSELSAVERAERWAAMVEEQVFAADDSAFADIGGTVGASGKANAGFATLGASASGDMFRRYDKAGLAASIGDDRFALALGQGRQAAEDRRRAAAGRTVGSIGFSLTAEAAIAGQKVAFGASFSAEKAGGDDNTFAKNWGVELTAALGFAPGTMSEVEQIAGGFVSGILSTMQNVGQAAQKQKAGSAVLDSTAEFARLLNAGMKNELTNGLGKLWEVDGSQLGNVVGDSTSAIDKAAGLATSSSLQAAVIFGMAGGKGVFRIEVRDTKSMSINIGGGVNVGVTVQADRSKRLLALGGVGDGQGGAVTPEIEAVGLRPPKRRA